MGQAKSRGSRDERIQQAIAEQHREEPINIPCQSCKEPLNGFDLLKTSPSGAAWVKVCICGAQTVTLMQPKNGNMVRTFKMSLGMSDEISGGKRVGVSFIEKTVDSVETGMIRF